MTVRTFRHVFQEGLDEQNTAEFAVNVIGCRRPLAHVYRAPEGRPVWLIAFFYAAAFAEIERRVVRLAPNSLVVFPPGVPLRYGGPNRPAHSWWNCGGVRVRGILGEVGLPVYRAVTLPSPILFERYLAAMDAECRSHTPPDARFLANLFENWAIETDRARRASGRGVDSRLLAVREYMEEHYAARITLPDLARRARLSVSRFSVAFKSCFHVSPIEYVLRCRMKQAEYLLQDYGLKIHEVAREAGYDDIYHFSKLFKKHHGLSPLAYRRRHDPVAPAQ
ncbi:MAG: helix-turn-helix transcriptional regulator [Kiritimatiellae bacterium]|nr:helix-turn-helix transcriptional regulator [Kiritimatiellia bacterium]